MAEFTVHAGKDFDYHIIYKDSLGNVIPLTGASARMMIREDVYKPVLVTKAATITEIEGKIAFSLTSVDTASILTTKEKLKTEYDVELTFGGKTNIISSGIVNFKQPITRD